MTPFQLLILFALLCLSNWAHIIFASSQKPDNNQWMQVSSNVAFQSNQDLLIDKSMKEHATNTAIHRMVYSQQQQSFKIEPSYTYQLIDSSADYNEYQLAWHLLGFYVDCNTVQRYCTRYAMYAVYVNPDYRGGGIGEYYYYDASSSKWVCYNSGGCVSKMDCHLPDTHWKMLGVFKIDNISQGDGWMEQLFKHQGICVWGDDTYKFASNMRKKMPKDCTSTKQTLPSGHLLYYHVKPEQHGNLTLGLYIDDICSQEYNGEEGYYDVFELSGYDKSYLSLFNTALDTWKQCQPCISHNLNYQGFDCYDDAGYTNCNQCMKFSNKAGCKIAERQDIDFAAAQNGLVAFEVNGKSYGSGGIGRDVRRSIATRPMMASSREKVPFSLLLSFIFLVAGLVCFVKATVKNVKQMKQIRKRIFCGDDNSTIRTERLLNTSTTLDVPNNDDDEVMSTISRISSKISPQAKLVRVYSGDEVGSHCESSNPSYYSSNLPNESDVVSMDNGITTNNPKDSSWKGSSEMVILDEEYALSRILSDLAAVKQALVQFTQPLTLPEATTSTSTILKPSRLAMTDTNSSKGLEESKQSNSKRSRTKQQNLLVEQVDEKAERWIQIGNDFLSRGKYEDAYKAYSEAIRISPKGPQSHVYYSKRAATLLVLRNYQDAAKDAQWSIALQPTFAKGYARLGQALHFGQDFKGAIIAYNEALKHADNDAEADIYRMYVTEAKNEMKANQQTNKTTVQEICRSQK